MNSLVDHRARTRGGMQADGLVQIGSRMGVWHVCKRMGVMVSSSSGRARDGTVAIVIVIGKSWGRDKR